MHAGRSCVGVDEPFLLREDASSVEVIGSVLLPRCPLNALEGVEGIPSVAEEERVRTLVIGWRQQHDELGLDHPLAIKLVSDRAKVLPSVGR